MTARRPESQPQSRGQKQNKQEEAVACLESQHSNSKMGGEQRRLPEVHGPGICPREACWTASPEYPAQEQHKTCLGTSGARAPTPRSSFLDHTCIMAHACSYTNEKKLTMSEMLVHTHDIYTSGAHIHTTYLPLLCLYSKCTLLACFMTIELVLENPI